MITQVHDLIPVLFNHDQDEQPPEILLVKRLNSGFRMLSG